MATERARVSALATWVGQQLKAVRALLPQYRSLTKAIGTTIALNTNTDVTVTWATPLADANYWCWVVPVGSAGVVAGTVMLTVKSQTAAGCVVTVRPSLALAATYTFKAYAIRLPGGVSDL